MACSLFFLTTSFTRSGHICVVVAFSCPLDRGFSFKPECQLFYPNFLSFVFVFPSCIIMPVLYTLALQFHGTTGLYKVGENVIIIISWNHCSTEFVDMMSYNVVEDTAYPSVA